MEKKFFFFQKTRTDAALTFFFFSLKKSVFITLPGRDLIVGRKDKQLVFVTDSTTPPRVLTPRSRPNIGSICEKNEANAPMLVSKDSQWLLISCAPRRRGWG